MENEIKINDLYTPNQTFIDKIKSNKNILIICGVVVGVLLCYALFGSKISDASSASSGSKLKHYDYLIVDSGLYGATFNYLAKKAGKTTFVVEKCKVNGGNLYCENPEGIFIHKYGPYIFHTDNKKVWDFENSLTHFNPYIQQTGANVDNKLYSLPFNMWTYNKLWIVTTPEEARAKIDLQKHSGEIHNLEEQALFLVGKDIYETLIKEYTEKQQGRECINLPSFIIKRLSTRFTFDRNYFNDKYQGIPEGFYNSMMEQLLKDTEVVTDVDYNKNREKYEKLADKIVYT